MRISRLTYAKVCPIQKKSNHPYMDGTGKVIYTITYAIPKPDLKICLEK